MGNGTSHIRIGSRQIGSGAPVLIIAEAGVNHNGDIELAEEMVRVAVECGADAVKFQSFLAERVASSSAAKADYQRMAGRPDESQIAMLRPLQLSVGDHERLQRQCTEAGLLFLSTPFDDISADLLDDLDVAAFKIASGEVTNIPFLQNLARRGRPLILSTGMSTLEEVGEAIETVKNAGAKEIALLHCLSAYPAEPGEVNLRCIQTMARAYKLPVGFSDHTKGVEIAIAAVAVGACIIEKHFTLDRDLPGPDQRTSLLPCELKAMVQGIRNVEKALGSGIKQPTESELPNRISVRRSIAATRDMPASTVLSSDSLCTLRPATGIPPGQLSAVVGRRLRRDVSAGTVLNWSDLV